MPGSAEQTVAAPIPAPPGVPGASASVSNHGQAVHPDGSPAEPRGVWVDSLRSDVLAGQQPRLARVPFLVRRARLEVGQNAGSFVKCEVGDRTGWLEAVWWNGGRLPEAERETLLSTPVWIVDGLASLNRFGGRAVPQLKIEAATGLDVDPSTLPDLVRRSHRSEEELGAWLTAQIRRVRNPHLQRLLQSTLGERGAWREGYLRIPAGQRMHHAYVGGLADHVYEMATVWVTAGGTFPSVDRDLTLAGILLHDVGKLDTLASDPSPRITRCGSYIDHISAGIARLSLAIQSLPGFPETLRDHLLHIVASHHGEKEHGSPVIPATREAVVVHHLDRLSSLLSHFEDWSQQVGVDESGWTTESSPWLKVRLARSPEIPGGPPES